MSSCWLIIFGKRAASTRTKRICGALKVGVLRGAKLFSEEGRPHVLPGLGPHPEAPAGPVDVCRQLAEMLSEYVGDRRSGLLFHSSTGAQLLQSNALSDSLHPILDYMAHERGGFNIFRRFRLTHLEKSDCPEPLKRFGQGTPPSM